MSRELILLRGLPAAGKTTFAQLLGGVHLEADMYFEHPIRGYEFNASLLRDAHNWCKDASEAALSFAYNNNANVRVVVSNTFTTEQELAPYLLLGDKYQCRVFTLIVENRHQGVSVHQVPEETINKMRNRFTIKL